MKICHNFKVVNFTKTMYNKMGTVSNDIFLKIIANNAHTDISNVKMD